ncbi:MAG TPA: AAA family ATPase [Steroidobacteraceae bacterium]|nr:AAA family ATPase [Steroidobacteraceae bacterium]
MVQTELKELTAADVSSYLGDVDLKTVTIPADTAAYQEAAAVLAAVQDPAKLHTSTGESGEGASALQDDLVDTPRADVFGGAQMLRLDVRREALARLATPAAMLELLSKNEHERGSPLQQQFEQTLRGKMPPLAKQSITELEASLQISIWLEQLALGNVPRPDEVRRVLGVERFVQPFRRLAGDHFAGRVNELDELRLFVGILPPETLTARVRGQVSRLLSVKPKAILNLFGPGGVGKSALVARFFLDHIKQPDRERVPFAYIDFDSPFINIRDLSSVVGEMHRQLRLQFPQLPATLPPMQSAESVRKNLSSILEQIATAAQQPFLVVLDTFEEVQYGGEAQALPLFDLLQAMQKEWPFLRVLVSGRLPIQSLTLNGVKPVPLELEGVDEPAAVAILDRAGVAPELARTLIKQVGRVPLSLRLAAAVVAKQGAAKDGVKDLDTTSYLFFSVSDEVIQGQLYERILEHLHSPALEKLAHPGLVLRTLNADVIFEVLNEPCELHLTEPDQAAALYDALAKETALVSIEADGGLKHRPDVRRTMLKLLVEKSPRKARDIRHRAIEYYSKKTGPSALAEELYHRLMLGEKLYARAEDLRNRDVRISLGPSLPEMPVSAQLFLSGQGYEVSPEVLKEASDEQLEEHAAASARERMTYGPSGWSSALQQISSLRYRGGDSPLYLEAARLRLLGNELGPLFELLDEGIKYAIAAQNTARALDLICLKAWGLEKAGRDADLARTLPYLARTAERCGRELARVQLFAQQYRLCKRRGDESAAHLALESLAQLLLTLGSKDLLDIAPVLIDVMPALAIGHGDAVRHLQSLLVAALTKSISSQNVVRIFQPGWRFPEPLLDSEQGDGSPIVIAKTVDDAIRAWAIPLPYVLGEWVDA